MRRREHGERDDSGDEGSPRESFASMRPGGVPKRVIIMVVVAVALLLFGAGVSGMLGAGMQGSSLAVSAWAQGMAGCMGAASEGGPSKVRDPMWGLPPGKVFVHADGMQKLRSGSEKDLGGGGAAIVDGFKPLQ